MNELDVIRSVNFDWAMRISDVWSDAAWDTPELHANVRSEFARKLEVMRTEPDGGIAPGLGHRRERWNRQDPLTRVVPTRGDPAEVCLRPCGYDRRPEFLGDPSSRAISTRFSSPSRPACSSTDGCSGTSSSGLDRTSPSPRSFPSWRSEKARTCRVTSGKCSPRSARSPRRRRSSTRTSSAPSSA